MRALTANEVEVRVGNIGKKGVTMLLYKNARVDRQILDEEFGQMNWQDRYSEHKGNLFCAIGVDDADKHEWVWKEDCGTESQTEKEKGEASDSFKRACFNWGIGRELYTAPFIFIPAEKANIQNYGGKWKTYDTFSVEKIAYENGAISGLSIRNDKTGKRCFVWQFIRKEK